MGALDWSRWGRGGLAPAPCPSLPSLTSPFQPVYLAQSLSETHTSSPTASGWAIVHEGPFLTPHLKVRRPVEKWLCNLKAMDCVNLAQLHLVVEPQFHHLCNRDNTPDLRGSVDLV